MAIGTLSNVGRPLPLLPVPLKPSRKVRPIKAPRLSPLASAAKRRKHPSPM